MNAYERKAPSREDEFGEEPDVKAREEVQKAGAEHFDQMTATEEPVLILEGGEIKKAPAESITEQQPVQPKPQPVPYSGRGDRT